MANTGPYRALKACINRRAGDLVPSCGARGADRLAARIEAELAGAGLPLVLETAHCMGKCHLGPTLRLVPAGPFLMGVTPDTVPELVRFLRDGDIDGAARRFPLEEE